MPTYQYACTECHDQFEVVQKFTDDALSKCPHCGGRLRKVFSAVGVVFKGSGFYRTDSRGAGSAAPAAAGSGAASNASSDGGGSGSSSSDGAAAASTPSAPAAAKPSGGSGAAAAS